MFSHRTYIGELLYLYEGLLTKMQITVGGLYFHDDYSLSEISQELNITRSAVQITIARLEQKLLKFEDVVGLYQINEQISKLLDEDDLQQIKSKLRKIIE